MLTALVTIASLALPPIQNPKPAGRLTEAEFQKLHELKQEAAPPRTGTMVEVAGSKAYLSLPPGAKAPMPGIVVIHEWWGLNEHVMHWSDRLAAEGYAALAVDLYGGKVAKTPEEANAAMKQVDAARAKEILLAAHAFLKEDPRVQATKRASIGWCFGGRKSLELALAAPDLDAAVMYYGHPVVDAAALAPLKAPLLGIFGTQDKSIPPEDVKTFDEALTAAGKAHEIHSYDAPHAFANPSNPRYDGENAAKAWEVVRAFLAKHLRGGGEAKEPPKPLGKPEPVPEKKKEPGKDPK